MPWTFVHGTRLISASAGGKGRPCVQYPKNQRYLDLQLLKGATEWITWSRRLFSKTLTHLFQLDHVSCRLFWEDWLDNGNFLQLRITYKVAHKARSMLALFGNSKKFPQDGDKRGESVQGEGQAPLGCINYHVCLICITQGSFLPCGCG